jgi:hypothetical protein
MTVLRRALVLAALALWLGGFIFYSAVVVPIGSARLGFNVQGGITQRVTEVLNVVGIVALLPLGWDALAGAPARGRWPRRALWLVLAATLAGLWALHPLLADLMGPAGEGVRQRPHFRRLHLAYLGVSAAQWLAGVLYLVLTVRDWRRVDQAGASSVSRASSAAAASSAVGPA